MSESHREQGFPASGEGSRHFGPDEAGEVLALLLDQSNDAIYILAGARFPIVNRKFQVLFGVTPEQVNGEGFNFMDLVAERSHPMLKERAARIGRGEPVPSRYEFTACTPAGREIEVEASTTRILFRGEEATLGIVRDITERKRAEERLRESEERLRAVVSSNPIVLWAVDREGIFTVSRGKGLRKLGLQPGEAVGGSAYEMYAEVPEIEESIRRTLTGESFRQVVAVGDLYFETHYAPILDEEQQIVGAMGVSADVTERQEMEDQLRQAAKMEAIGRLAGGIAHDFNNILTVIAGNAEIGLFTLEEDHPLRDRLGAIQQASAHAHDLTSRLLAFSRKQISSPRILDLNKVMRNMEPMLQRLLGEKTLFKSAYSEETVGVRADPGQLEQVLVNLVVNAHDAMPDGGSISVETAICELGPDYIRTHPYVEPRMYVCLSVTDTGHGMTDEVMAQVFEPFFTTKPQGTGLGLSTVYGIVKQADGYIEIDSTPGEGTRIEIFLPLAEGEPEETPLRSRYDDLPGGNEHVLLVEDERAVRDLTEEMLRDLGYSVAAFGDPSEAERYFDSDGGNVDLLLTDVVMPGISGVELARRFTGGRPDLKVLFMSGYTDDQIADHGVLGAGVKLLPKPFGGADLARMVRRTLDFSNDLTE